MKYKLIGVAGKAGAGKDTTTYIIQEFLQGYETIAFADNIKRMLMVGLGLTVDQMYGKEKSILDKRYNKTPRQMMQNLGTDWAHNFLGNDVWVKALDNTMDKKLAYIITDVRFEAEADYVRKNNGVIIHVRRKVKQDNHSSEKGIYVDSKDITLENEGSLQDLTMAIDYMVKEYLI